MENKAGIYKITSPTGRIYIGSSNHIQKRWNAYRILSRVKGQTRLYNSFVKYGVDSHKFEVIEFIEDTSLLYQREAYWGEYFNSIGTNGLNCILPKANDIWQNVSEETLGKRSKSLKGNGLGSKRSADARERMSKAKLGKYDGECNPFFGKKHSDETKNKMVNNHRSKKEGALKVILDTATGIYYEGSRECSELTKINLNTLKSYLSGHLKNKTNLIYV